MTNTTNTNADECCVSITLTQEELVRFQHFLWLSRFSGTFCIIKPTVELIDKVIDQVNTQQPDLADKVSEFGSKVNRGEVI